MKTMWIIATEASILKEPMFTMKPQYTQCNKISLHYRIKLKSTKNVLIFQSELNYNKFRD